MQRGEKRKRYSEDDEARSKEKSVEIQPVQSEVRGRVVSGDWGERQAGQGVDSSGCLEPGREGRPGVNSEQLFNLICIHFLYMYSLEIIIIR